MLSCGWKLLPQNHLASIQVFAHTLLLEGLHAYFKMTVLSLNLTMVLPFSLLLYFYLQHILSGMAMYFAFLSVYCLSSPTRMWISSGPDFTVKSSGPGVTVYGSCSISLLSNWVNFCLSPPEGTSTTFNCREWEWVNLDTSLSSLAFWKVNFSFLV